MTRFALSVEYDGRGFVGWQRQAHGASVQQTLEDAAQILAGTPVVVHGAGRTDAGVHALAMRAHLDLDRDIAPFRVMEALNALARPAPVAVIGCEVVADDWHARFSCRARHYRYVIVNRRAPMTVERGLAWQVPRALDEAAMADAAATLIGRHDFTTFRSAHCQAASPLRSLDRLAVARNGDRVTIEASARSFLHHQVRSMVGCLALVGMGRWPAAQVGAVLAARDRAMLGLNAPADGLYFVGADY